MQASTKTGKKKDPEKKGIMKFAWNDQQKMDHGIDPIIWNSWNEKWNAAGMNSWTDFYKVPVEHGGPTSLEISAYTRAKQQWAAEAYDGKRQTTRHKNHYHITYPAGKCVSSPRMIRAATKDETARIESPARPRKEALINRNDPEYADLVGTQAEVDLVAAEFGDLCVAEHPDVLVDDGEDDVVDLDIDDEPLAVVPMEPPAFMHSPLVLRDRKHCVLLYVAEYEGRMRVKAEQAVAALNAKLEEAQQYERALTEEAFRLEHELQAEYGRRSEIIFRSRAAISAEMDEEVTRLTGLFQDVSLLTRDALGGN